MNSNNSPFLILNYKTLISELNKKGLFSDAEKLSRAFNLYKKAEIHLYKVFEEEAEDLLNFAHPDGNVEILPSAQRMGEVHTINSTQEKILETLSRNPNGKYSNNIRSGIFTAAKVLGIDLEKFAQNTDVDIELMDPETRKKIIEANTRIQIVLDGNQQTLQAASDATGVIDGNLAEWLKFTENSVMSGKGLSFYLKTLEKNNSPAEFQKFKIAYNNLSQGQELSSEGIARIIFSLKSVDAMHSFFRGIEPTLADRYFGGSVIVGVDASDADEWKEINEKAAKDIAFRNRPESVWTLNFSYWSGRGLLTDPKPQINSAKVNAVAEVFFKWLTEWKLWYFSPEKLENANQILIKELTPLKSSIDNLKNITDSKKFLANYKVLKTSGLATGRLESINGITDEVIKNLKSSGEIYNSLGAAQVPASIVTSLNASKVALAKLTGEISQVQINPILDNPIDAEISSQILNTFREMSTIWRGYQTSGEVSEEDASTVENNFNQSYGIYSVISNNAEKPYAFILSQIGAWVPKAKTPEQLLQIGQQELAYAKSVVPQQFQTKAKTEIDQLIKKAFDKLKGKPGAGSQTVGKLPNKTMGGQTNNSGANVIPGLKKFDQNDPAQAMVAQMQLALNVFGRLISQEETSSKFPKVQNYDSNDGLKIIGTGPKSNPHLNMFDGIWGTNTNNALILAQKYISSLGHSLKTGVKWSAALKSHTETAETEAKQNIAILRKINNYLSGRKADKDQILDTAIFDQLPKNINWNLEVGPAQASFDKGEVNVAKNNLASLQNLYDFLTLNGMKNPQVTGATETNIGSEGWLHEDWINALQWFIRRAVLKYNAVKDGGQEAATNAKDYWDSANRLWQTYKQMISTYLKSGQIKSDQVINKNLIAEFSKGNAGAGNNFDNTLQNKNIEQKTVEEGAAYMPDDASKSQKSNFGQGGVGSGRDGSRFAKPGEQPITLPFANTINLRDEELWSNFDGSELSSPILRLADFQKVPGPRMAQILFATTNNPQKAQRVAIENLGYNPVQYDDANDEWLIKGTQNKKPVLIPASRVLSQKQIQTAMQQYMSAAPIKKYQKFLGDLSSKIAEVLQEWSQDAPEEMIIHVQDYYKYWQQAISKQTRDLNRAKI